MSELGIFIKFKWDFIQDFVLGKKMFPLKNAYLKNALEPQYVNSNLAK